VTVSPKLAARYEIGDLLVDVGLRRVTRVGEDVPLGRLTFDLLVALAERAPRVVTQRELDKCVWADRVVNPETVAQRIKILRQSLGDDARNPRYIRVVRGQGYQLIPPVERFVSEPEEIARLAQRSGPSPICAEPKSPESRSQLRWLHW
jgi:DNA-binding winged helix-turn-helix (wHTH) protein